LNREYVILVLVLMLAPVDAFAQTEPGAPPSTTRVRFGPLYINPTLALTNAGIDSNVFNEPDALGPKQDFTMTVTPAADAWLRFGPTWLNGNIKEDLVYFQTYSDQNSANTSTRLNWTIPLNRLTLNPGVAYLSTNDRPGFEIDTRAHRTEFDYNGTLELRLMSRTFVGARFDQRYTNYDPSAEFNGVNLREELNRTVTTAGLTVRYQATSLTSIIFDATRENDRFEFSPIRDTDSTHFQGGFKFDPAALLKGSAFVGYRDFRPLARDVPGFQGVTAAVNLSYVPLSSTLLAFTIARDVQFSYDVNQPYYLQTGGTASISQQIFGPVDVVGRIGAQRLEYRDREGAPVTVAGRADHVETYGGGVGYHIGSDLRIGFNVDKQHRISVLQSSEYNALRFGVAVTYGM
jgi:hypothetical protein